MHLDVYSSVNEADTGQLLGKTVIAIDVLRATSTMITALSHGSSGIIPVETVQQALKLRSDERLLGGERFCKKIAGFELGNSPSEYSRAAVSGKQLVLTTTNGTRAILRAGRDSKVLAGALLNAASCAQAACQEEREIAILCAGTKDEFALEDGLCAGLIIEELLALRKQQGDSVIRLNDFGWAMLHAYRHVRDHLTEALLGSKNGFRLSAIGFKDDVLYCSQTNVSTVVPVLDNGIMVPLQF